MRYYKYIIDDQSFLNSDSAEKEKLLGGYVYEDQKKVIYTRRWPGGE